MKHYFTSHKLALNFFTLVLSLFVLSFPVQAQIGCNGCYEDLSCESGTPHVLMMYNMYYGGGWNGNILDIMNSEGVMIQSFTQTDNSTMASYDGQSVQFCLEDGCYTFLGNDQGQWAYEAAWGIYNELHEEVAAGVIPSSGSFSVNTVCDELTDCQLFTMNLSDTHETLGGWFGDSYSIYGSSGVVASGVTTHLQEQQNEYCLAPGCYTLETNRKTYSNSTYALINSQADTVQSLLLEGMNTYSFSTLDNNCEELTGCTDPLALNYNIEATEEDSSCLYDSPNWTFDYTGGYHSVFIIEGASILINGLQASDGSAVGLFFTNSAGETQCAGYTILNGETVQIPVMADDATTPEIDGYVEGEELLFIVWDINTGIEWDATVSYSYNNGLNNFSLNAISIVSSIETHMGPTEQLISLPLGWSTFSTYMASENRLVSEILDDIYEHFLIVKDYTGMAFLPGWDFSSLGEIQDGQGYHIKTTQACAFTVEGSYLLPEENPINLNDGWNLIGYLREEPADIAAILYTIIDDIVIAKDYLGYSYLPEWEFNGIGEMTPGSAYQIKTTQATILEFNANDVSYRLMGSNVKAEQSSKMFTPINTGDNMQIVFPEEVWETMLAVGDEILAYDSSHNLIGATRYLNPLTVLTLWGDDETTIIKDGLSFNEQISFELWSKEIQKPIKIDTWLEGNSLYLSNGISVVASAEYSVEELSTITLFEAVPNPANVNSTISFYLPEEAKVTITLYNVVGEVLEVIVESNFKSGLHSQHINVGSFGAGIYYYKMCANNFMSTKHLHIVK